MSKLFYLNTRKKEKIWISKISSSAYIWKIWYLYSKCIYLCCLRMKGPNDRSPCVSMDVFKEVDTVTQSRLKLDVGEVKRMKWVSLERLEENSSRPATTNENSGSQSRSCIAFHASLVTDEANSVNHSAFILGLFLQLL